MPFVLLCQIISFNVYATRIAAILVWCVKALASVHAKMVAHALPTITMAPLCTIVVVLTALGNLIYLPIQS